MDITTIKLMTSLDQFHFIDINKLKKKNSKEIAQIAIPFLVLARRQENTVSSTPKIQNGIHHLLDLWLIARIIKIKHSGLNSAAAITKGGFAL